jgi:hypothetical protein
MSQINPNEHQPSNTDQHAACLAAISHALGVTVTRVLYNDTAKLRYRLITDRGDIAFRTDSAMANMQTFRGQMAAHLGIFLPKCKPLAWTLTVQAILDACEDSTDEPGT